MKVPQASAWLALVVRIMDSLDFQIYKNYSLVKIIMCPFLFLQHRKLKISHFLFGYCKSHELLTPALKNNVFPHQTLLKRMATKTGMTNKKAYQVVTLQNVLFSFSVEFIKCQRNPKPHSKSFQYFDISLIRSWEICTTYSNTQNFCSEIWDSFNV